LWLKLTNGFKDTYKWFKGYKTKGEDVNIKIKKGEVWSRGVWMMVSIQASVSGYNFVNSCKFMLALVVLS
jgi:hypothetical protein